MRIIQSLGFCACQHIRTGSKTSLPQLFKSSVRYVTKRTDSWDVSITSNPLQELQPYLQISILPEEDKAFTPTNEHIETAHAMFAPKYSHVIKVYKGTIYPEALPMFKESEVSVPLRTKIINLFV